MTITERERERERKRERERERERVTQPLVWFTITRIMDQYMFYGEQNCVDCIPYLNNQLQRP